MSKSYFTREQLLQFDRDRFNSTIEECVIAGFVINDFINNNDFIDYYRVNAGTIQTITTLGTGYIEYETRRLFDSNRGIISTGYYWKQRLRVNSDRIGKRKLYTSSKGTYFIENGFREYLKDYTIK